MASTDGSGRGQGRPSRRKLAIAGVIGAAVIVGAAAIGVVLTREGVGIPRAAEPLPGLLTGPAPWGPNTDDLRPRLDQLGRPLVPRPAGTPFRLAHLAVSANGQGIDVPAGIGVVPKSGSVAPLYTASNSGDVDSARAITSPFRLALFFKIWGVRFTKRCLGGYCGRLAVVVNGAPVPGDPRLLRLQPGQEIVVAIQR
jgi:hypothetical protein